MPPTIHCEVWTRRTRNQMKFHPFAERFPLLSAEALNNLAGSIKRSGQRVPIVVRKSDGIGIDGRNRWRACQMIGAEPLVEEIDVDENATIELIADLNLARRHLTTGENAELAAAYVIARKDAAAINSNLEIITPGRPDTGKTRVIEEAAAKFNVSKNTVRDAVAAIEADSKNAEKIRTGEVSTSKAAKQVREKKKAEKNPATPPVEAKPAEPEPAPLDKLKQPIPDKLLPVFANDGFAEIKRAFSTIRDTLTRLAGEPAGLHVRNHFEQRERYKIKGLDSAHYAIFDDGKPYCVCIACGGENKSCPSCKGHGFLTKYKHGQCKDTIEVESKFAAKRKGA